jgi:hypothetical protein
MQGFIQELKFSNFVVAARQDDPRVCIVNYISGNSGSRCFQSGMTDISGMSISMKYRHLYLSNRRQEFISVFELPEIGCGYNYLTQNCGNKFADFDSDLSHITCKTNSALQAYFNMGDQCRCNRGYFYNSQTKSCSACLSGCINCNGPNLNNCLRFFIDTKSQTQVSSIASFDTSVVDTTGGASGIVTLTGTVAKSYKLEHQGQNSVLLRTWSVNQTQSSDPRIMTQQIFTNSRGEVITLGKKIS